jgi:hypothetical protein
MKNLVCLLMVLALAASAFAADVDFSASDEGGGKLQISYTCNDPCNPRGIALAIDGSNASDTATVTGTADVVSVNSAFNTYIDFAYDGVVDPCDPCSYQPGQGHPLAKTSAAGVPASYPESEFSVCMGVLDESGNQAAGPASTSNLITLQLDSDDPCVPIVISADTLRAPDSGVVGSSLTSNLPITVYVEFVTVPTCWNYTTFCYGDADGSGEVNTSDWPALRDAFFTDYCSDTPVDMNNAQPGEYNPCGDFNKDGYVDTVDWPPLRDNFFTTPPADCSTGGTWPPLSCGP